MKSKVKIIAHSLVKNEERFIWYSLQSVLPYVDKIMVWDTGSTDNTVKIIKSINSPKIEFKALASVTPEEFTKVSQQMIKDTPKDYTWMLVLDGDEVWPQTSIKKVTAFARKHPQFQSIVVPTNNLVGDIFHCLPRSAGQYHLAGRHGHLALRLSNLKTIPGLHYDRPHGQRGLFDKDNTLIQDLDPQKIKFINAPYHHATHLQRSSSRQQDLQVPKRSFKLKYELGRRIPRSQVPQVFFQPHPDFVPAVSKPMSTAFLLRSLIQTPLRRLKRLFINPSHGY